MSHYEEQMQRAIDLVSQNFNSFQVDNMTSSRIQWEYERLTTAGVKLRPKPLPRNPFKYLSPLDSSCLSKYGDKINVVYFFYGAEHELLYVGRTNNFVKRWVDHCNSGKQMHLVKFVGVHVFDTKPEVMFYEAQKILQLKPAWNIVGTHGKISQHEMNPKSVDNFVCSKEDR